VRAKKLVGREGEWRVRTGDHRIVYEVHDDVLVVLVVAVGHRRDSYEHRGRTPGPAAFSQGRKRPERPTSGCCIRRCASMTPWRTAKRMMK